MVVHDKVFVERVAGTPASVPNPSGTVVFHRYTTIDCTGSPTDETKTLAADGTAESSDFNATANMSYKAHYNGDANYGAHDGACEPLGVTLPCPAGVFVAGTGAGSGPGDLAIAYDQFPAPNDNSYGVNAVGWGGKTHTFGNLTGSDKAGFQIVRPNGTVALSFNLDYISSTAVSGAAPSGYASLGPFGGDGSIVTNSVPALTNDPAKITWDTSEARNLNKTGVLRRRSTGDREAGDGGLRRGFGGRGYVFGSVRRLAEDAEHDRQLRAEDAESVGRVVHEPGVRGDEPVARAAVPGREHGQRLELPQHVSS